MEVKNVVQNIHQEAYMSRQATPNSEINTENLVSKSDISSTQSDKASKEEIGADGEPIKKSGRKIDDSEPVSRRLAQNRAAQKAFRERRENFVRSLQERVKALEEANKITKEENQTLINSIKVLEQANQQLKTTVPYDLNSTLPNQPFPPINNGFNNFGMLNYDQNSFQQNFTPEMSSIFPAGSIPMNTDLNAVNSTANLQNPLVDMNIGYSIPLNNDPAFTGDEFLFPEFPNFPSLEGSTLIPNPAPTGNIFTNNMINSPHLRSSMNPLTPLSLGTQNNTPEPNTNGKTRLENLDKSIMPGVSAYELMKPDRPPPTKEELLQLAAKHKIVMDKLKTETYTIDELCEALKKKATCSAVRGFLSAYLGENFDQH